MAEKTEKEDLGVIPYILSPDAENHMKWLKTVFAATEKAMHRDEGSKKIIHAALCINGGVIFSDGSCLPEQVSLLSFSCVLLKLGAISCSLSKRRKLLQFKYLNCRAKNLIHGVK